MWTSLHCGNRGQAEYEVINGVHVHRIQPRVVNERSKATFLYRLLKFFVKSAAYLTRSTLNGNGPYDLIHVHSVPDFEVFAALIPKIKGTKIILDIHDIVPEFYTSKFDVSQDSFIFKGLMFCREDLDGLCRSRHHRKPPLGKDHHRAIRQEGEVFDISQLPRLHFLPELSQDPDGQQGPDDLSRVIEPAPGCRHRGQSL